MSVPGSSSAQAQQNHRMAILEDLQEKKKRMSARMQSTGPGGSSMPLKDSIMAMRDPQEAQMSAAKQQQALQHALNNSAAYFITQDSSFGNLILPVIPRIPPPPE